MSNTSGNNDHGGVYYHGAKADEIKSIIQSGVLRPNGQGNIFLTRYSWEGCLQHGADVRRGASFVVKIRVYPPSEARTIYTETPGVRDTVIIQTDLPIKADVLELWIRRLKNGAAQMTKVSGIDQINQYLGALG